MATKPASTAPWATDSTYPMDGEPEEGTTNKVDPGEEDTVGWRPGRKPPAQKMNKWQYLIHTWMEYLDDGDLDGPIVVDGDLDCTTLAVSTDASIGDDLEVIGDLTGDAGAPVLVPAGAEGIAFYHTTPLALKIPAIASVECGGPNHSRTSTGGHWLVAAAATKIVYPIVLPQGARITSWELYIDKTSTGDATAQIYRQHDDANTEAAVGSGDTLSGNVGETFFSESVNHDVGTQYSYYLVFTPSGNANDLLGHAFVYWTMPPP